MSELRVLPPEQRYDLKSRYAWNINANTGVCSPHDTSGTAQHNIVFTATAPGGYQLDIATNRMGDLNRISDVLNCEGSADTSSITGTSDVALSWARSASPTLATSRTAGAPRCRSTRTARRPSSG